MPWDGKFRVRLEDAWPGKRQGLERRVGWVGIARIDGMHE